MLRKFLVSIMRQHLDEALAGPYATLGVLEKRMEALEDDWSSAADELDRTYKKVHSELGHISRQKRGKKTAGNGTEEETIPHRPPLPLPFGGAGRIMPNRFLNESGFTDAE